MHLSQNPSLLQVEQLLSRPGIVLSCLESSRTQRKLGKGVLYYHGNHRSKNKTSLQSCHRSSLGKAESLFVDYPGPRLTTSQNVAPHVPLHSGALFWERSATLHLMMPSLSPGIETTLTRAAVSGLWALTVWGKAQHKGKTVKEINRLKTDPQHAVTQIYINGIRGHNYSTSRGLLAL